jgi:hypothetical protein
MRSLAVVVSALVLTGCASVGTARTANAPAGTPVASAPVATLSSAMASPSVVAGSEGSVPPMPAGGRTLDTNDPNSVWMAQNVVARRS